MILLVRAIHVGRIRTRVAVAVAVMVAVAATVGIAGAGQASFKDPDEKPFCEGGDCPDTDYMDFRRATQGHGAKPRQLRHGVHTYKRWKTKVLGGRRGTTIVIYFDVNGKNRPERQVKIRRKDGKLWAAMFRGRPYFRRRIPGRVLVWRPDRRSIKVGFPARLLRDDIDRYRWRIEWWARNTVCPGSCHDDWAPNRGWYEHRL